MTVFDKAFESYSIPHNLYAPNNTRIEQLSKLTQILNKNFPFKNIWALETGGSQSWKDGMVGYYFAYLANNTKGKFASVDIDPNLEEKVYQAYYDIDPNLEITHFTSDSVNFLKYPPYIPNLVHLDSWDVNLKDPLPSTLHGWREFESIESKMPIGSIIVVDDNWYGGQKIPWKYYYSDGTKIEELIDIKYPTGKGAHILQWVEKGDTNWKILDAGYKLIIQKQW